jgi:hypothetical protein
LRPSALGARFALSIAALIITLACGCAVPLAPGFHIEKEQAEAQYVANPNPRLHVHATYHVQNTGNTPLSLLDVNLPNPAVVARENLRVTVQGTAASIEPSAETLPPTHTTAPFQIHFEKEWSEKQRIAIEIDFDITATNNRSVLLAGNGFALDNFAWFPKFEAPKRFLGKGDDRADPTEISILVPQSFFALSSGEPLGKKTRSGQLEYRFRIRRYDPDPFLVAGHYNQQSSRVADSTVYLWTFAALSADAQHAAEQLAAAASFFDSSFGARAPKKKYPIWLAEIPSAAITPTPDSQATTSESPSRSQSLPNVILLTPEEVAQTISRGQVTDAELTLLAETWTRWIAIPRPDECFLGPSLATYAVRAWHESREGNSAHRAQIAALLSAYDASHTSIQNSQPTAPVAKKTPAQETMSREKATLFLAALEDQCTPSRFRQALAYSLNALRGREYGYDDLRAGLHSQGCAELGPTFREWLGQPGIPKEFRSRHGAGETAPAPSTPPAAQPN